MIPERVKSTFPRQEQHRVLLGTALCSARLTVWPDLNPGISLTAGHGLSEGGTQQLLWLCFRISEGKLPNPAQGSFLISSLVITWGPGHGGRLWRVSVPSWYKILSHLRCSRGDRTESTSHKQQSPRSALQHKISSEQLIYQRPRRKPLSSRGIEYSTLSAYTS